MSFLFFAFKAWYCSEEEEEAFILHLYITVWGNSLFFAYAS